MIQRKRDYGTSLLELNDEEEEDEDEENASPSPEMKGFLDTYDLNKKYVYRTSPLANYLTMTFAVAH